MTLSLVFMIDTVTAADVEQTLPKDEGCFDAEHLVGNYTEPVATNYTEPAYRQAMQGTHYSARSVGKITIQVAAGIKKTMWSHPSANGDIHMNRKHNLAGGPGIFKDDHFDRYALYSTIKAIKKVHSTLTAGDLTNIIQARLDAGTAATATLTAAVTAQKLKVDEQTAALEAATISTETLQTKAAELTGVLTSAVTGLKTAIEGAVEDLKNATLKAKQDFAKLTADSGVETKQVLQELAKVKGELKRLSDANSSHWNLIIVGMLAVLLLIGCGTVFMQVSGASKHPPSAPRRRRHHDIENPRRKH